MDQCFASTSDEHLTALAMMPRKLTMFETTMPDGYLPALPSSMRHTHFGSTHHVNNVRPSGALMEEGTGKSPGFRSWQDSNLRGETPMDF